MSNTYKRKIDVVSQTILGDAPSIALSVSNAPNLAKLLTSNTFISQTEFVEVIIEEQTHTKFRPH